MEDLKAKKNMTGLILKILAGAAVLAGVFLLYRFLNISAKLSQVLDWINQSGWIGIVVYILIYIAACVLLIPGSVLTLGAGFIFGVVKGSLIVSLASTLGAAAAFIAGRTIARNWIRKKIENNQKFNHIDQAIEKEGWIIVFLTRLSPLFPFNLLNYGLGLTRVKLKDYVFWSWLGMIPGTVMYVYIGSLAGSLATLSGTRVRSPLELALYGAGLLATIAVTVIITRIARKALTRRIEGEKQ